VATAVGIVGSVGSGRTLWLADGRALGFDDVGDPDGTPALYVHGSPDSRRARHPDDAVAERLGVRLVAVDRPGAGLSTLNPTGTFASFADDAIALADHLDIAAWRPLGWSAGAPFALAIAARHPGRVARVGVAAGLVPFEAYATPELLADVDAGRSMVAELGAELGPTGFAEVAAPMLAPYPCDLALAREHVLETPGPDRRNELASIPGLLNTMAAGVVDSVADGLAGLTHDLELQVEPPDVDWSAVSAPVDLWYGGLDTTAPPAFATWWQDELLDATVHLVEGAGHLIAMTHWTQILATLRST